MYLNFFCFNVIDKSNNSSIKINVKKILPNK